MGKKGNTKQDGQDSFDNPLDDEEAAEDEPSGRIESTAKTFEGADADAPRAEEAEFDHKMTDDELSDLTYAFQACDIDGAGTIEPEELHGMMAVLGAEVDLHTVQVVMKESTELFKKWMEEQLAKDSKAAEAELNLPAAMEEGNDGKESGHHGDTKHGGKRHHMPLTIKKKHPIIRFGQHPMMAPVRVPMTYSAKLMYISGKVVVSPVRRSRKSKDPYKGLSDADRAKAVEEAMLSDQHMVFAEFIYLMGHREVLDRLVPGDWHKQADKMRKYRHAFDSADVDGDNAVDFEELEMVLVAMDPHHSLTHDDMLYLWGVICRLDHTPEDQEAATGTPLDFNAFLHGMAAVSKDPKCTGWMDVDKANKWELMSLIIDTPVSKAEEARIIDGLTGIEKLGINMIKANHTAMEREHMRDVLTRVGEGKLRVLNAKQVDRMSDLKKKAILWSALVALVCTIMPAYTENLLCEELAVDGVKDAYWVCHEQSHRVTNSTQTPLDDWFEPSTPMDPDEMLCTTMHVNKSSCMNNFFDGLVETSKEKYGSTGDSTGADYVDKDFYRWGLDTEDSHRTDMVAVGFDPLFLKFDPVTGLPSTTYTSIKSVCNQCECWVCACVNHKGGVINVGKENKLIAFWVILGTVIGLNIVFEIGGLMYCSVYYATRVAWAMDIRLNPLNADRAFVADSLIRAAFELGNPDNPVMGVDPHADEGGHLAKAIAVGLYKGKVVISGLALKTLVGKVTEPEFGLWWKPWLGMVSATIMWDALIAHCILLQAQIRGFGIFTSCEVFNEIVDLYYKDENEISELGKIQIARACGIAIVQKGCMYPTLELLLRHAIQFLGLRGKSVVSEPGVLDNVEDFLKDLQDCSAQTAKLANLAENITKDDQVVVLSVLLLALVLDGNIGRQEKKLWKAACAACDPATAEYYPKRLVHLSTLFREFQAITAKDLFDCFDPKATYDVPNAAHAKQFWFDVGECLSC